MMELILSAFSIRRMKEIQGVDTLLLFDDRRKAFSGERNPRRIGNSKEREIRASSERSFEKSNSRRVMKSRDDSVCIPRQAVLVNFRMVGSCLILQNPGEYVLVLGDFQLYIDIGLVPSGDLDDFARPH